jgi:hypothetical protein
MVPPFYICCLLFKAFHTDAGSKRLPEASRVAIGSVTGTLIGFFSLEKACVTTNNIDNTGLLVASIGIAVVLYKRKKAERYNFQLKNNTRRY